jgi:hypothetical protein
VKKKKKRQCVSLVMEHRVVIVVHQTEYIPPGRRCANRICSNTMVAKKCPVLLEPNLINDMNPQVDEDGHWCYSKTVWPAPAKDVYPVVTEIDYHLGGPYDGLVGPYSCPTNATNPYYAGPMCGYINKTQINGILKGMDSYQILGFASDNERRGTTQSRTQPVSRVIVSVSLSDLNANKILAFLSLLNADKAWFWHDNEHTDGQYEDMFVKSVVRYLTERMSTTRIRGKPTCKGVGDYVPGQCPRVDFLDADNNKLRKVVAQMSSFFKDKFNHAYDDAKETYCTLYPREASFCV